MRARAGAEKVRERERDALVKFHCLLFARRCYAVVEGLLNVYLYTEKNVLLKITMFYCNRETDSNS